MFYIYKILLENNKYYLGISEENIPKNSEILFKTKNRDDIPGMAEAIHRNTKQDPNRVFEAPKKPERKKLAHTLEFRKKLREYRLGRPWSKEVRDKISSTITNQYRYGNRKGSKPNLHQTLSEDTKAKMRESHSNRLRVICPHCGESSAINMFNRWHGDNCKFNW